jgi:hypothetical protein
MSLKKLLLLFGLILFSINLWAQRGDPRLLRNGRHTGNKIGISFHNDGAIAGTIAGVDIRGEWPLGSGFYYIGDLTPLIGVEFLNNQGLTKHSVEISRGPRKGQSNKKSPVDGHFWGFNPVAGYFNQRQESIAMSHLPNSWPTDGWPEHPDWINNKTGHTDWWGYFGRSVFNADQESYFVADDNSDDEFNAAFHPDTNDFTRNGMGLRMSIRGLQWSNFLAENCIFWLYNIKNEGTTTYKKANFGTIVGTLAGGESQANYNLGEFDPQDWVTYSWDSNKYGDKGQLVGWVGYAFLESPGNPFDGIDNDGDSQDPSEANHFIDSDFDSTKVFNAGDKIILIDPVSYKRTTDVIKNGINTVYSLDHQFIIEPGVTKRSEGYVTGIDKGTYLVDQSAYDGLDNDLDGLIDENEAIDLEARVRHGLKGLKYINYLANDDGSSDPLIDEHRDNPAGSIISSWCKSLTTGNAELVSHWSGDENGNWNVETDDVGSDGIGPYEIDYPGPDVDGTEGNGRPDQGEPNFGETDPDESDQIGLTAFNFFELQSGPDMSNNEDLWYRMSPGKFDAIDPKPMDGDFIYASGFFPLAPKQTERFSTSILFGQDRPDVLASKRIVQQIYNAGYRFSQPPPKPKLSISQLDGKVLLYWDGYRSENSINLITRVNDFQGYKIFRATDAGFLDSRQISNGFGVMKFDQPIAQFDLVDSVQGFFYPSEEMLNLAQGMPYYLGSNSGLVHQWIDTTVVKGQTYYYAVCAYNSGLEKGADKVSPSKEFFPVNNSKYIFRQSDGSVTTDINTGYITPGARPLGYKPAASSFVTAAKGNLGTGSASVSIVDDRAIKDDETYYIIFEDSVITGETKNWSLIKSSTKEILVDRSEVFVGETPITEGIRPQIMNSKTKWDTSKSFFQGTPGPNQKSFVPFEYDIYKGIPVPNDYLVEFYDHVVGNSFADTELGVESVPITFKIKNLITNQYIDFAYINDNSSSLFTQHLIIFNEKIENRNYRTWELIFKYNERNAPIESKGTYTIGTFKPFQSTDTLSFSVTGSKVENQVISDNLNMIKVVPNPYVVTHDQEQRLLPGQSSGRGERKIRFTHIPTGSKISIFTVRGELIKKLTNTDAFDGDVIWNLRTDENLDVAFGVYVYVVEVPNVGNKTGKIALIK